MVTIFEKIIRAGIIRPDDAASALAKGREKVRRRGGPKRKKRYPVKGPLRTREHWFARGRRPKGELVRRIVAKKPGARGVSTLAPFPDGRSRSLQVLGAMMTQPGLWWGLADLKRVLCPSARPEGMSYGSLKAIVGKLMARGWIERTGAKQPRAGPGVNVATRRGTAWRLYRPTRDGRMVVEICR